MGLHFDYRRGLDWDLFGMWLKVKAVPPALLSKVSFFNSEIL
jgi:hypothetical protein